MRIRRWAGAFLLSGCSLLAQYTPAPNAEALYRKGLELWASGSKQEAIRSYRDAAKAGHEVAIGLLTIHLRNGNLAQYDVVTEFDRSLMTSPPISAPAPSRPAARSSSSSVNPERWQWIAGVFKAAGLDRLSERELDALNTHVGDLITLTIKMAGDQSGRVSNPIPPSSPSTAGEAFESQIDGDFEGWEGDTIFKLMNGQIWIQDEFAYTYTYNFMPKVLIYKSRGLWRMKVEGMNETIRVRRLK